MREYLAQLKEWINSGHQVAIARVVKTWGSSPRPIGSVMLVNEKGEMLGSVSGGCVEGEVVKAALSLFENGKPQLLQFGVSDDEAWTVGLSCGGEVHVFLEIFDNNELWSTLLEKTGSNKACTLVTNLTNHANTLIAGSTVMGAELKTGIKEFAIKASEERATRNTEQDGDHYFIHVFQKRPLLLAIGAAHVTSALVSLAKSFDFETIVIDPRGHFASKTSFPDKPDQLLTAYPSEVLGKFDLDEYSFAAILSHDPKIDDDALEILLPSKSAYIGALGSKKNQAKRVKRLSEKGFSQELIDKIKGPIGLDIHAKSAQEIALSIIAEIVQTKNQFL